MSDNHDKKPFSVKLEDTQNGLHIWWSKTKDIWGLNLGCRKTMAKYDIALPTGKSNTPEYKAQWTEAKAKAKALAKDLASGKAECAAKTAEDRFEAGLPAYSDTHEGGFVYTALEKREAAIKINRTAALRLGKRRFADVIRNSATYIFSLISLVVLVGIIYYVFATGSSTLSWRFITGNNQAETYTVALPENVYAGEEGKFTYNAGENEFFSTKWGVAFKDTTKADGSADMVISYVDPASPFRQLQEELDGKYTKIDVTGFSIKSITGTDRNGKMTSPVFARSKAKAAIANLDKMDTITNGLLQSEGGGIAGPLLATLYFILISLAIALPFGIGGAVYLAFYAKNNVLTRTIRSLIDMISGIPSIIFGLAGAIIFVPMFGGANGNVISGSLTLACMVLPTVIKNTEEAIKVIPPSMKKASLALGASQAQTIFKIVIPNSVPGILTGTLLAIGRILGESAALVFATGTFIADPNTGVVMQSSASLAVYIWKVMNVENPNYAAASATAILILIVVLILNILVKLIGSKLDKFSPKPPKSWLRKMWDNQVKKWKANQAAKESMKADNTQKPEGGKA